MNILMLTTHLNIGGVAKYILDLSQGLAKRGVHPFIASSGGDILRYFESSNIPHLDLNIKTKFEFHPKLIPGALRLIRFVRDNKIDIIHAHTRVAQVLGGIVSTSTGVPFVSTCHGFFNVKKLSRKLFPCWGVKTIAISNAVKRHLVHDFNIPEERVDVVYNGVNVENYISDLSDGERQILREQMGFSNGPVVGTIGRLSPVKGYDYLLHAIKKVKKIIPHVNLLIVGEGPYEKVLRKLAKTLDLETSVFIMASTVQTQKFFPLINVYVFPSLQEGLGLSLLEAMASQRACIATSVGGIRDIIEDGRNGLLVPPSDIDKLAEGIRKLILDEGLASKISRAARESVGAKFSFDAMVSKTIDFYQGVINEK